MLLIDIRSTNASAAEFILDRLKLYLAGRHHHHNSTRRRDGRDVCDFLPLSGRRPKPSLELPNGGLVAAHLISVT